MSFYRYGVEFRESPDAETKYSRSLIPLPPEVCYRTPFWSYRYYTSEKEDAPTWHVISLGHECRWPNKEALRRTERFVLHYAVRGKALFNGRTVRAGQYFFMHPGMTNTLESDPVDPLEFYYIGIAGPGTNAIMEDAGFLRLAESVQECPFVGEIPALFYGILHTAHPESDPDYLLQSFFLALVARHKALNIVDRDVSSENAYYYYKNAMNYIQEYITEGIGPSDVAAYLHISPSYLRTIFHRYCRYSLREYLIRRRIAHAANLLSFSDCSVAAAGAEVGYPDYTLFSKMFRKYTGMSPTAWRQESRGNADARPDDRAARIAESPDLAEEAPANGYE